MAADSPPRLNDEMFKVAYEELRRLARTLNRDGRDATLTPTALVHEAYLKLTNSGRFQAVSPQHLKYTVVRAMKHILLDAARRRATEIHGGHLRRVSLDDTNTDVASIDPRDLLSVGFALDELARLSELPARAFELQYFGGLEVSEIASVMAVTRKRAQQLLRLAKAQLAKALTHGQHADGSTTT